MFLLILNNAFVLVKFVKNSLLAISVSEFFIKSSLRIGVVSNIFLNPKSSARIVWTAIETRNC